MSRPQQLSLLDWTPPEATARFDDIRVRAASIHGRISRAIGAALKDCGVERAEIARRMSGYLGEPVTTNMLNAYASQAREDHAISVPRFIALITATGDRRLLQLLAEDQGWAVIEKRHLPLIELAAVQDKLAELELHRAALKRRARSAGGL
jgi:hypothetical protein